MNRCIRTITSGKKNEKEEECTSECEDVPLVELMYLVFTCMPGERYCRRLRSLLGLCDVFRALINSLLCCFDYF